MGYTPNWKDSFRFFQTVTIRLVSHLILAKKTHLCKYVHYMPFKDIINTFSSDIIYTLNADISNSYQYGEGERLVRYLKEDHILDFRCSTGKDR